MLLSQNVFFVREHVAALKLTDTYDILDSESQSNIGVAREEPPGWAKWLRLVVNKGLLPTVVNVYETGSDEPVIVIRKPVQLLRAKVTVYDAGGRALGYFKSKLLSLGGGFHVYDMEDNLVAEIKGDWKGWNFRFISKTNVEIGTVTKQWAGIGKELFTSADNYVISISEDISNNKIAKSLLIAAGLSIDIVFKENQ